MVLSGYAARALVLAQGAGLSGVEVSVDLNLSRTRVYIETDGARLSDDAWVGWEALERLARHPNHCVVVDADGVQKISLFSETTRRQVSLYATEFGAPTMVLAGFPMHRIKGIDPWGDTEEKLKAASPVPARVLDTATGLGYTAIAAARLGAHVTTIELDPGVLRIARQNPWSAELFTSDRIEQRTGSAAEIVPELPSAAFDLILHDPPTVQLAGELYGEPFYEALRMRLSNRGRLFHYIGSPDSRQGASLTRGTIRRLKAVGFSKVTAAPQAFGVVAHR